MSDIESNRALQVELYGEPVRDLVGRVSGTFNLTQSRVAEVLGVSAPMLSQLISAKRIKISNPAVVGRLQALLDLAAKSPELTGEQLGAALDRIRDRDVTLTHMDRHGPRTETIAYLRAIADREDLIAVAQRARSRAPQLADLLQEAGGSDD